MTSVRVVWMGIGVVLLGGCPSDYTVLDLVGGDGELRFNLQFTNESEVDLDLHVRTPGGFDIYYSDPVDPSGGELDVDCYCGDCPQGPNENIFWPQGSAAEAGTYSVSVEYFAPCGFDFPLPTSDYTLRILHAGAVVETYTGTLGDFGQRDVYSHVYGQ